LDFLVDKIEVDFLRNPPQDTILADAFFLAETGHKELVLIRRLATHHGKNLADPVFAMIVVL
jgi:hypothetical protein